MNTENPPQNPLVVDLPSKQAEIAAELRKLNETLSENPTRDVIIDFSKVEIITSASLSNLLILRNLLAEHNHSLILSNVSVMTKCIFTVAGLDKVFDFAADKTDALAAVHKPG